MKRTTAIVLGLLLTLGVFFQTEAQSLPTDARALSSTRVPLLVARQRLFPSSNRSARSG